MDILMLGHSLIEFYDWESRYPRHNVKNLGVAGETVEGLLDRTGAIISKFPKADLVFIMTGANNLAMDDYDFLSPYERIIMRLKSAYPDATIYVLSILPVLFDWISPGSIEKLNDAIKGLARKYEAEYIDLYDEFTERGKAKLEYIMDDGVHLSSEGYEAWGKVLDGIINEE
ncbi:MAG: GDSL family lipase [Nitrospirota bacterium]|nr:MAG: GDSL family lipase [Nitrospirota bacterium]